MAQSWKGRRVPRRAVRRHEVLALLRIILLRVRRARIAGPVPGRKLSTAPGQVEADVVSGLRRCTPVVVARGSRTARRRAAARRAAGGRGARSSAAPDCRASDTLRRVPERRQVLGRFDPTPPEERRQSREGNDPSCAPSRHTPVHCSARACETTRRMFLFRGATSETRRASCASRATGFAFSLDSTLEAGCRRHPGFASSTCNDPA